MKMLLGKALLIIAIIVTTSFKPFHSEDDITSTMQNRKKKDSRSNSKLVRLFLIDGWEPERRGSHSLLLNG